MCVIRVSSKLKLSSASTPMEYNYPPLDAGTVSTLRSVSNQTIMDRFRNRKMDCTCKELIRKSNVLPCLSSLYFKRNFMTHKLWLRTFQRAQSTVNVIFDFLIILVVWRHQQMTHHRHDPLRLPLVFFLLLLILLQNDHPFSVWFHLALFHSRQVVLLKTFHSLLHLGVLVLHFHPVSFSKNDFKAKYREF